MIDDLSNSPFSAVGLVLVESCGEVSARLTYVYFAALARDSVYSWPALGVLSVLV